ncbi:hypothetical protein SM124_09075 [Bacillus sp. 31A1R]|uniref:Uncharacterized protein n=1 Tax=Robertmurraya mangrovi TaxID=3098077 RepID=A0ABU5IXK0_9BACI|nr:hypothetical protein [Bacillus sp. 31A1R]MDZ5471899.1 hypothetical protein [Bacillus sp. 31A1R]
MDNNKLDRLEDMVSQLINIVGETNEMVRSMKTEISDMKVEISDMKAKNENRHKEVMGRLQDIEVDQDLLWEKTIKNERSVAKIVRPKN